MTSPTRRWYSRRWWRREQTLVFIVADKAGASQAVHDGHFYVHEDDIEIVFLVQLGAVFLVAPVYAVFEPFQRFLTVTCYADVPAELLQLLPKHLLVDEVVFYDEYVESDRLHGFFACHGTTRDGASLHGSRVDLVGGWVGEARAYEEGECGALLFLGVDSDGASL